MTQDNKIRLPPTTIDFENDVGLSGQEHDIYPAPGQPRFDWMRMYLIGLLSSQSSDTPPNQFRIGTPWLDTSSTPPALKMWDGGAWLDVGNLIYVGENLTLQQWFDVVSDTGSLELPIPATAVTYDDDGASITAIDVQKAIDEILTLITNITVGDATTITAGIVRLAPLGDDDNSDGITVVQTDDPRLTGATLVSDDKALIALATSSDGDDALATGITSSPAGYVMVAVNGILVEVGDGVITKDCYFGVGSDGNQVRATNAVTTGDILFWNGSIVGYELEVTDKIDLIYEV